jgi:peptidoglycan/xylan/chitin deacetylase (PgdA/CDA1 family)
MDMTFLRPLLRSALASLLLAGCASAGVEHGSAPDGPEASVVPTEGTSTPDVGMDAPPPPPFTTGDVVLQGVTPEAGSVEGGTLLTVSGVFPDPTYSVHVGGAACTSVTKRSASALTCVTGKRSPHDADVDVVVIDAVKKVFTKPAAFHYFCPWTYGPDAVRSCGAAPPARIVSPQSHASTVTAFQAGHGFSAVGAGDQNLNDTSDFTAGTQSALMRTSGNGSFARLVRRGAAPVDFTGKSPKVWIKVDNVAKAKIELRLGTSANDYFSFRMVARQKQEFATEGDWVSFTMPFGTQPTVGSPDRSAITDVEMVVQDDATAPVTLHVNGLALVAEPLAKYPHGVVSFTFDDGYATQARVAAPIMHAAGFPGTAYLITELVGVNGPNTYMTAAEAKALQDDMGWEIGVHSFLKNVHTVGFPAVAAADLETDIVAARGWLMSNGLDGYDHCAYPHGHFTGATEVLTLARKYFTSCRTIISTAQENVIPSDAAKLRIFLVSYTMPLSTVIARVNEALANHEWLILAFHNFSAGTPLPGRTNDWPAPDFAALVDYMKSKPIAVKTVGQVLAE